MAGLEPSWILGFLNMLTNFFSSKGDHFSLLPDLGKVLTYQKKTKRVLMLFELMILWTKLKSQESV